VSRSDHEKSATPSLELTTAIAFPGWIVTALPLVDPVTLKLRGHPEGDLLFARPHAPEHQCRAQSERREIVRRPGRFVGLEIPHDADPLRDAERFEAGRKAVSEGSKARRRAPPRSRR
jgi:hypothetical protein